MDEKELKRELDDLRKDLEKKLERKEIDPDDAVDMFLEKQSEVEAKLELLRREDGNYCKKLFQENIKAFAEVKVGIIGRTRLDIQNMSTREIMLENLKDLKRIRGAITGWKWLKTNEEEFLNAAVKLLLVSVRQNQVLMQKPAGE